MNARTIFSPRLILFVILIIVLVVTVFRPQSRASAATAMTITPITWNIIGLDSNNVNVGPNHFPVGARVCNTSTAGETLTGVSSSFALANTNPFISLRPGTNTSYSGYTLSAGSCIDFYYEVEVTRTAAAYGTTEQYTITADSNETMEVSTPTPRELFVERLISQSRNAVTDVQYGTSLASLTSVAAGGTMNLMVGNTYFIRMTGFTATQGYEQIEYFINIPNTIFQILSVSSTFTADSSPTVGPSPKDKLYGDNCVWENDPNSPNYRACLSTGKTGGDIQVTYQVRILQVPGAPLVNPQPLSTLIYDFSGSSFHYNADFGVSTRYANIVSTSLIKTFSPKTINPGGTSTLTFTISNPGSAALTGVNFIDDLPAGMTLANSSVTYTGCGASPSPATVSDPLTFSNITVAGLSTCMIAVSVTASTNGTYNNTSNNLFINTSVDTGSFATDSLVVSSNPPPPSSCTTPVTIATWTMPTSGQGSGGPPPPYTTKATDVSTATAAAALTGAGSQSIDTTVGNPVNSWRILDNWSTGTTAPGVTSGPYFEFSLDTSNYGGVQIGFDYDMLATNNWGGTNAYYVYSSANGGAYALAGSASATKGSWQTPAGVSASTTGTSTTSFRISFTSRSPTQGAANVYLDNIIIRGCPPLNKPTLSKAFSPTTISENSNSTLTFTLTNPNTGTALTGVGFSDTLPTGLLIATPNGLTQSCSVGTLTGGTTTATAGTSTISLSSATLSANANCTISVNVLGDVAGQYTNVSGTITSTETGASTSSTGFGTASLTVVAPPVINKAFTANPIFTGNSTALTFTISNPNTATILTGVSFTDTLPAGLDVVTSSSSQCGGTLTVTNNAPLQDTISLSGGSLAVGASCSFSVTVIGTTVGLKTNSVTVSSTNGGTGNTSTADVLVKTATPAITLLKQVGSSSSGPWTSFLAVTLPGSVYYRFTVENVGDIAVSAVDVTDPSLTSPSPASCSWVDGNGTLLTAPFSLPVANANDDQLAICVLGPFMATSGSNSNTATADDNNPSVPSVNDTSTATYATAALTLDKTAAQTSFNLAGEVLNYSYLVTNSGFAPLLGPVTITDDKVTVTCPAASTVGDLDAYLDLGESLTCNATYTTTLADVLAASVTNIAFATASGVQSNTDSVTVYRSLADLSVTKTNDVNNTIALGNSFNWTISVSNTGLGVGTFLFGDRILIDNLPGIATYFPQGPLNETIGGIAPMGTIDCSITGTTLVCDAGIGGSPCLSIVLSALYF